MDFASRYPDTLRRFERWWRGADTDRPVLYIHYPRTGSSPAAAKPEPASPQDRLRPEVMAELWGHSRSRTGFHAEGFPHIFVNFGPGVLHAAIGGDLDAHDRNTIWFPPFLKDLEEFLALSFDPASRWWRAVTEATELLLERFGDEALVSYTDIGGCADVLASSLGTEQLLMEVAMRPELVRQCAEHCYRLWSEAYENNHALLARRQSVFTTWYPFVAPGRTYMSQCDINAMLGPDSFRELFAPQLGSAFKNQDFAAYHLDGQGTEPHVPALLEGGGLKALQWVPPPGVSALERLEMLRGVQDAGVSVMFNLKDNARELETCCRKLDPRRLFLVVKCADEADARRIVEDALRWSG